MVAAAIISPLVSLPPSVPREVSPPSAPSLRDDLKETLEERVKTGQITSEESQRAMKDILADFESGRRPAEVLNKAESSGAPKPISAPQELKPALGSVGPADPGKTILPTIMAKWQVTPPPTAPAGNAATPSLPTVTEAMNKVLTDFGKVSLSPDDKPGSTPTNEEKGRLQTAGVAPASGTNSPTISDNTGASPSIKVKSGGVVGWGAPPEPQKKVASWLGKFVDEYLKRGKTPGIDNRRLASPHPIGLPKGALIEREEPKVSFVPEGRGDFLFLAQAAPEAFLKHTSFQMLLLWTLLGIIGFKAVLMLRRKTDERDEEDRKEPKIG